MANRVGIQPFCNGTGTYTVLIRISNLIRSMCFQCFDLRLLDWWHLIISFPSLYINGKLTFHAYLTSLVREALIATGIKGFRCFCVYFVLWDWALGIVFLRLFLYVALLLHFTELNRWSFKLGILKICSKILLSSPDLEFLLVSRYTGFPGTKWNWSVSCLGQNKLKLP